MSHANEHDSNRDNNAIHTIQYEYRNNYSHITNMHDLNIESARSHSYTESCAAAREARPCVERPTHTRFGYASA